MGSVERRQREKAEMRGRISRAAMKLFLAEGFERTSIRRIAQEIEYTPGAIYSYFKDKDEILYALHNEGFDRLAVAFAGIAPSPDPFEDLMHCGEAYLRFALENPEYYDLMFMMEATGNKIQENKEWREGLRAYDFLRERVYACMKRGRIPAGDPEAAAYGMWAAVHGMASLIIRNRCVMFPAEQLPKIAAAAFDVLIHAFERTPSPKAKPKVPAFQPFATTKVGKRKSK